MKQKILAKGETPRVESIETTEEINLGSSLEEEESEISLGEDYYNVEYSPSEDDVHIEVCDLGYCDDLQESSDKRLNLEGVEEELMNFVTSDNHHASRKTNFFISGKLGHNHSRFANFSGNIAESILNKDSRSIHSILKNGDLYSRERKHRLNSCGVKKTMERANRKGVRFNEMSTVYLVQKYMEDEGDVKSNHC